MFVSLTCGARSTVSIDQSTVNTGWVLAGPVVLRVGPVWAGPGQTRGRLWHSHVTAMGPYWAVVYGGRKFTVHGAKAGSMVDQVHLSSLSLWFTCTGCMGMWPARGGVPLFLTAAVLLPAASSR